MAKTRVRQNLSNVSVTMTSTDTAILLYISYCVCWSISNTHESSISTTSKCVWCVSDPRIEYNKRKQANYY